MRMGSSGEPHRSVSGTHLCFQKYLHCFLPRTSLPSPPVSCLSKDSFNRWRHWMKHMYTELCDLSPADKSQVPQTNPSPPLLCAEESEFAWEGFWVHVCLVTAVQTEEVLCIWKMKLFARVRGVWLRVTDVCFCAGHTLSSPALQRQVGEMALRPTAFSFGGKDNMTSSVISPARRGSPPHTNSHRLRFLKVLVFFLLHPFICEFLGGLQAPRDPITGTSSDFSCWLCPTLPLPLGAAELAFGLVSPRRREFSAGLLRKHLHTQRART